MADFEKCKKFPKKCPAGFETEKHETEHFDGGSFSSSTSHYFEKGTPCKFECRKAADERAKQLINHSVILITNRGIIDIGS